MINVATKKTSKQTKKEKINPLLKKEVVKVDVDDIIDNPLSSQTLKGELSISPDEETERKMELISEVENLAEITKQHLQARRKRVEVEVDNKKLDIAKKTIDAVDKIIASVMEAGTMERVSQNINKPLDLKLMSESAEKLSNVLKSLMSKNSVDELGTRKRQKINFMFKTSGAVQGAVQIENGDDD